MGRGDTHIQYIQYIYILTGAHIHTHPDKQDLRLSGARPVDDSYKIWPGGHSHGLWWQTPGGWKLKCSGRLDEGQDVSSRSWGLGTFSPESFVWILQMVAECVCGFTEMWRSSSIKDYIRPAIPWREAFKPSANLENVFSVVLFLARLALTCVSTWGLHTLYLRCLRLGWFCFFGGLFCVVYRLARHSWFRYLTFGLDLWLHEPAVYFIFCGCLNKNGERGRLASVLLGCECLMTAALSLI